MDRLYPALEIRFQTLPGPDRMEQLLAFLDEQTPTAIDEREYGVVVFFPNAERRDRAADVARVFAPEASVTPLSISDESWAERSQAALTAIRVDRVIVTPPWARVTTPPPNEEIVITIVPSMGFGTGHHASTRLCLRLLQPWRWGAGSVLDVGTGSGVLAIAAWRFGATRVVAIDVDPDAVKSARENVELNGAVETVELRVADLSDRTNEFIDGFDLVLANLTGSVLGRFATELSSLVALGGQLIVSGFQTDEEERLTKHFTADGLTLDARLEEERWIGLRLLRP
jgi:ribosomal protein L11 methyltransferase